MMDRVRDGLRDSARAESLMQQRPGGIGDNHSIFHHDGPAHINPGSATGPSVSPSPAGLAESSGSSLCTHLLEARRQGTWWLARVAADELVKPLNPEVMARGHQRRRLRRRCWALRLAFSKGVSW